MGAEKSLRKIRPANRCLGPTGHHLPLVGLIPASNYLNLIPHNFSLRVLLQSLHRILRLEIRDFHEQSEPCSLGLIDHQDETSNFPTCLFIFVLEPNVFPSKRMMFSVIRQIFDPFFYFSRNRILFLRRK